MPIKSEFPGTPDSRFGESACLLAESPLASIPARAARRGACSGNHAHLRVDVRGVSRAPGSPEGDASPPPRGAPPQVSRRLRPVLRRRRGGGRRTRARHPGAGRNRRGRRAHHLSVPPERGGRRRARGVGGPHGAPLLRQTLQRVLHRRPQPIPRAEDRHALAGGEGGGHGQGPVLVRREAMRRILRSRILRGPLRIQRGGGEERSARQAPRVRVVRAEAQPRSRLRLPEGIRRERRSTTEAERRARRRQPTQTTTPRRRRERRRER